MAADALEAALRRGVARALNERDLVSWAREVGALLPFGAVVALHGDLGAGKTTVARALCEGLRVVDVSAVTSPTFAIVHEYDTPGGVVAHADLYRLRDARDLDNLGWDDLVARARATLVEWPDRVPAAIPPDAVHLRLAHDAQDSNRRIIVVE
jgi:tRNA threonylcarbamoyl adenosine modification protein YjeE